MRPFKLHIKSAYLLRGIPVLIPLVCLIILSVPGYGQRKITILHTNDLHSSLMETSPANHQDSTIGGFSRIATIIRDEKQNSTYPVIAVDAGDFLMGTLFQVLEPQTGFQLHLMQEMGYDAIALGNHEFDFGISTLADYATKAYALGAPPLLQSNLGYQENNPDQEAFAELYKKNIVKEYHIIEKEGIRIGLFSLLGREALATAPNARILDYKGTVFTARRLVKILRDEEKADLIICLSHGGVYQNEQGAWRMNKEDLWLANAVKGIDVIISGHTHTALKEPLMVNGTPVVQAWEHGQYVGKLTIDLDNRDAIAYELIPVNQSIAQHETIQAEIDEQFKAVKEFVKAETHLVYDSAYFETQYLLKPDEEEPEAANIGEFIADAMRYYVNKYDSIGTNITFIAQGFIRCELPPGAHDLGGVFEVTSLGKGYDDIPGYPLSRLYFTGQELKRMLEFILIAAQRNPSYHCFFSGIKLVIDEDGLFMQKIKEIYIADKNNVYQRVDFSKENKQLYASTADAFMMEFFTQIKKASHGLVNLNPKLSNGEIANNIHAALIDIDPQTPGIQEAKIWKSVIEYGNSFEDTNNNGIPDIPDTYRISNQ